MSAQHFVKLKRSEIVVPAKFGNGAGFLVLSHWFVVLSFEFIFDFSVRIWYNGFGNWSGDLLDKSEFIKEDMDETVFMFALFKCRKFDKRRN